MQKQSYFACSEFLKFAKILSEMKKILIFITVFALWTGNVGAAVRDGNGASRAAGTPTTTTQKRIATTEKTNRTTTPRTTVLGQQRGTTTNASDTSRNTTERATSSVASRTSTKTVAARATTTENTMLETRTGAQYETCKNAYFTCMDQFCSLKNDDYRRCSCSNRVDSLAASRDVLTSAGEKLTVFTESLDVVGMTAAQATAMRTATDGENAISSDSSASKALLQAIMNSIRGSGTTTVGGKYTDLNSINMSFDTSTSFDNDASQVIASYNGQALYSAVYSQCRNAVREDCNNASLQRAVTAYLMAIEQDCNTVQTAIEQKQKELKSAIREGGALLDLARVENRQKHNSDDITTCVNNIESAILSEEVCGRNYHKCLDNGEYIDISTGAPITGVVKFYELGNLLTFNTNANAASQKLSKISANRTFVNNFEKRTKKFAEPALDKCTEIADEAWSEYLDKAMLAIYYAQQSKVSEIKQGCFDFVSKCYENTDAAITNAMAQLIGDSTISLQPDKVKLSTQMCTDYVDSCNNMFAGNIIANYVEMREKEDVLSACRAVVKQCFSKYGGTGYENFYYPYSGLFETGKALDWFSLYEHEYDADTNTSTKALKSPCAKQLAEIASCNSQDILEKAFGGLDSILADVRIDNANGTLYFVEVDKNDTIATTMYGLKGTNRLRHRELRAVGVATEVYNQIIDTLSTQCMNINGRFMEVQFLHDGVYNSSNYCLWNNNLTSSNDIRLSGYGILNSENMCPRDYGLSVDTQSWGACSCWGNGGRRSENGRTATCVAELPTSDTVPANTYCSENNPVSSNPASWCTQKYRDSTNRVCPGGYQTTQEEGDTGRIVCSPSNGSTGQSIDSLVPEGI